MEVVAVVLSGLSLVLLVVLTAYLFKRKNENTLFLDKKDKEEIVGEFGKNISLITNTLKTSVDGFGESVKNNLNNMSEKIKENREKAFRATNHFDGITDGYGDAVRHCYWCALNQVSAGLNSPNAKKFGDAHEGTSNNDINARVMDLHNNSVGYHLGNQAIINGLSEEELLKQVINAADNGKLKIIK